MPDLGERDSLVTTTSILAVRVEPPEATPGAPVRYDVLAATPEGPIAAPLARWAHCASPKLLVENGAVSAACLRDEGARPIGDGPAIETTLPTDACNVFGPNVTRQDLRPRDPDVTGGYFQPVRVIVGDHVGFGMTRVSCGLASAPADIAAEHQARYTANRNPVLDPIAQGPVTRGARVTLRASWPAEAAEPYVVYDLAARALVPHRESMRVSWFATAGTFDADRSGRAEEEPELFTENGWTAPNVPGTAHLFVVLRDARGGTTFQTLAVEVR
ncbi:MAG: hypothetical protein KIT84_38965 [Labilithrix sp.]|nr:hypothetical protein [Labilithrix sp.]MCW5817044.1 hypothetical protein [Labilithrix sp.]